MNPIKVLLVLLVMQFPGIVAMGQVPFNDPCNFSQVILIPDDGDTCVNGSTINATADGIYNSCDSLTTVPLPPGGNEVWFTYVATGTTNSITVNPSGSTPAQLLSVTIANGNCAGGTFLVCDKALAVNGPVSVNSTFAAGTQVWFSVTALTADGDFTVCVSSFTTPPIPAVGVGVDCSTAIPICDKHTFTSPGPVFNNATGPISCYAFGPQNVLWYSFTAGTGDSLIWLATPNPGYELDWAIYDITAGCPGVPVACNFATTAGGGAPTGMVSGSLNPCGPISQICTPIVLTAGNTYALHFNIENFLNIGIDTPAIKIEWGGIFKMAPYSDFSLSNNSGCDSVSTTFTNNSIGATNFQWDFGNGNSSNLQNPPAQSYTLPGTYIVSLIASNPLSCAHVSAMSVTVLPKPLADFTVSDTLICMGINDTANYAFFPDPAYSYSWNFAGATLVSGTAGTSGPYVMNWSSPGIKLLELTITDTITGCTSTLFTRTVTVISVPDSAFSMPASACEGQPIPITFTGVQAPGSVYNWNFGTATVLSGSGSGPYSISFAASGTYTVSLGVDLNGCFSDDTNSVTITVKPVSDAGADQLLCSGEIVQLGVSPNPLYTYNWSPGLALSDSVVADPSFTFFNTGSVSDTLMYILTTSAGSCSDEDTVRIIVRPGITSSFTLIDDTLCGSESTLISYAGNAGATATFNWNFAGGNAAAGGGQNYSVNWPVPTVDSVFLWVSENGCNSDTSYIPFVVGDLPDANAGPDRVLCSGSSDTLGVIPVPGILYAWAPATGLSSTTVANPVLSVLNSTNNPDTIWYSVNSQLGFCSAADTVRIITKPVQDASISGPVSVCINNTSVQYVNTSLQVNGATYLWDFGAANPSTSLAYNPPPVAFSSTGLQTVFLSVSTPGCPSDSDSIQVMVYGVPQPGFSLDPVSGCPGLTVGFTDTTSTQSGSTYFWDFGNGATSSLQNPVNMYQQPGIYDVSLTVITPDSCSATFTLSQAVHVFDLPVPAFTATPSVTDILNPQVQFISQSQNTDSCFYFFGDGFSSTSCNLDHLYQDTGLYVVLLLVISPEGCVDSIEHTVKVEAFETFYMANAFTPNGDGRNDLLTFDGSPLRDFRMEIFNRWGQMVFYTENQDAGWNGKDGRTGREAMEGSYAYKVVYRDMDGRKMLKKGVVTLIR